MAAMTTGTARFGGIRQYAHVVRVVASAEFKLKYSGSALGYVWSVVKPLGLFGMLYVVFAIDDSLSVGDEAGPTIDKFIDRAIANPGNNRYAFLRFVPRLAACCH